MEKPKTRAHRSTKIDKTSAKSIEQNESQKNMRLWHVCITMKKVLEDILEIAPN